MHNLKRFGWPLGVHKAPQGYGKPWLVVTDSGTQLFWTRAEAREGWKRAKGKEGGYTIVLSCDSDPAFAEWLESRGHNVSIGHDTGNHIDGRWTSRDEVANETMRALYEQWGKS